MKIMKPKFIKSAKDLQTTHEAIRKGFLEQAILKTERAAPYVEAAGIFERALKNSETLEDILSNSELRDDLITACGFSDKARMKLTAKELDESVRKVLAKIEKTTGELYKVDILYRYLLTKGDTLGGSMRNMTGSLAGIKLVELIAERLKAKKADIQLSKTKSGKVKRIAWGSRVLLFDVKLPSSIISNNIDVILLSSEESGNEDLDKTLLADETKYVACGELKGGIDPAGADEHWKTANSALGRIRTAFGRNGPALFFVGGAIEASMAKEIFKQLKTGKLTHAANLNVEEQVNDFVDWLISL